MARMQSSYSAPCTQHDNRLLQQVVIALHGGVQAKRLPALDHGWQREP